MWSEEQQISYVEFILRGGKTGRTVYFNHPQRTNSFDGGKVGFVCVDGLQRITALKRFINNEIPAFGILYKDFEGSVRRIEFMYININNLRTRKEVLRWYLEMNSGGTPHSQAELDRVSAMEKECNY